MILYEDLLHLKAQFTYLPMHLKTIDNKTSAAFCIPEFNIEHSARLADNITIFAAELCAIKLEVLDTCVRNSLLSWVSCRQAKLS